MKSLIFKVILLGQLFFSVQALSIYFALDAQNYLKIMPPKEFKKINDFLAIYSWPGHTHMINPLSKHAAEYRKFIKIHLAAMKQGSHAEIGFLKERLKGRYGKDIDILWVPDMFWTIWLINYMVQNDLDPTHPHLNEAAREFVEWYFKKGGDPFMETKEYYKHFEGMLGDILSNLNSITKVLEGRLVENSQTATAVGLKYDHQRRFIKPLIRALLRERDKLSKGESLLNNVLLLEVMAKDRNLAYFFRLTSGVSMRGRKALEQQLFSTDFNIDLPPLDFPTRIDPVLKDYFERGTGQGQTPSQGRNTENTYDVNLALDFPLEQKTNVGSALRDLKASVDRGLMETDFLELTYSMFQGCFNSTQYCPLYRILTKQTKGYDNERILYAILLPKDWLLTSGMHIFYMPKMDTRGCVFMQTSEPRPFFKKFLEVDLRKGPPLKALLSSSAIDLHQTEAAAQALEPDKKDANQPEKCCPIKNSFNKPYFVAYKDFQPDRLFQVTGLNDEKTEKYLSYLLQTTALIARNSWMVWFQDLRVTWRDVKSMNYLRRNQEEVLIFLQRTIESDYNVTLP